MNPSLYPCLPVLMVDDEAQALDSFETALRFEGINHIIPCQDSRDVMSLLSGLEDPKARLAVNAERAFLAALGGGCQTPIAAAAEANGERLLLIGMVADLSGETIIRRQTTGGEAEAEALGTRLAREILEAGADGILASVRSAAVAGQMGAA